MLKRFCLFALYMISTFNVVKVCGQSDRQIFDSSWEPKSYERPANNISKPLGAKTNSSILVTIDTSNKINKILPSIFGVNTTFRNGNDQRTRASLYKGTVNVMRYPAGSGSNLYFFNGVMPPSSQLSNYIDVDGISKQVQLINGLGAANMVPDTFVRFKQDVNGEAIVVVNYFYARYGKTSSGTRADRVAQAANYAASFVQKMNIELQANIKYWEIGNECYGKWETGFQVDNANIGTVTGKEYGEDFRVFANAMKAVDPSIKIGAIVKDINDSWNIQVLPEVQNHADFLSVHNYFVAQKNSTPSILYNSVAQIAAIKSDLESAVTTYTTKPSGYFPIAMTEFNARGPYNSGMFNALFISQVLGELIKNKYGLASMWVSEWNWDNTENESKAFLAKNDPNQSDYSPRPTYTPFYYFNRSMGNYLVQSSSSNDSLKVYASTFDTKEIGIALINLSHQSKVVEIEVLNNQERIGIDSMFWYEVYGDEFNPHPSGLHKKFYVNGKTATTLGGGPESLDTVPAYQSIYQRNSALNLKPHSLLFLTVKPSNTYIFDGLSNKDWFSNNNWLNGCRPPNNFKGNTRIISDCELNNNRPLPIKISGPVVIETGAKLTIK